MLLLAVLFSILVASTLSIYLKKILRSGVSALLLMSFSSVVGGLLLVPVLVVYPIRIDWNSFLLLFTVAVLRFASAWPINQSLKLADASFIVQFSSAQVIFSILFGALFLSEFPNVYGLFGVALIIFGSILLTRSPSPDFWRKAVVLRLIGDVILAGSAVLLKVGLRSNDPLSVGLLFWLIAGLLSLPIVFQIVVSSCDQRAAIKKNFFELFLISLLAVSCFLLQLYLFARIQVGYVFALLQMGLLVNVFFAGAFLREKKFSRRILPTFFIVCGAIVIYYFGK